MNSRVTHLCVTCKVPTNSRIFDYSFMNLLFDKENGSQIFGGRASRWLLITSAHSQHGLGSESHWLKTSSCSCHSAQGGSQFDRKVLETLAKFGELLDSLAARANDGDSSGLTMVWRPARLVSRGQTFLGVGSGHVRLQRGVTDVGTQQQTLVWPGCQVGGLLCDTDMARWGFGRGTFRIATHVR